MSDTTFLTLMVFVGIIVVGLLAVRHTEKRLIASTIQGTIITLLGFGTIILSLHYVTI